ncbi:MAG: J domain-containing protein [Peptococcaceae bacterium]|jgi:curved DNA-binding protein|nr:J domain-containing protein [Peptococcaceae bacterium]
MDFKDYYAILGVAENADAKAIKKAYQQLAKKYHPDKNPGDQKAEQTFKDAAEAYQALGDPENRKKYDELRQNYQQWQARGGRENFDWSRWQRQPGNGSQTRTMTPEEFAAIFGESGMGGFSAHGGAGGGGFSDFFSSIFGFEGMDDSRQRGNRRGGAYAASGRAYAGKGEDIELKVRITLEEAFMGTTRLIDNQDKRIEARIPPGVRTGSKVRVAGQGEVGGGGRGDLYLMITVEPHQRYQREGDDITTSVPVDFFTAVLGGEVLVQTLSGGLKLKLPPLSQNGVKFRLAGKGMPKLKNPKQSGDHYAVVDIVLPEHLSAEEIKVLRELAEHRHADG